MFSLYKILDGFARVVCWLAIILTFPFAIIMLAYFIGETLFRSNSMLESATAYILGALWVCFILLVLLATTYSQNPEKLTYKFWVAAFIRHACAWPIVAWAVLHTEIVIKMALAAGKWL